MEYINLGGVAAPRAQRISYDSIQALFSPDSAPETFDSSMNLLSQFKYLARVQRVSPGILAVSQHAESIREEYKTIRDHKGRKTRWDNHQKGEEVARTSAAIVIV